MNIIPMRMKIKLMDSIALYNRETTSLDDPSSCTLKLASDLTELKSGKAAGLSGSSYGKPIVTIFNTIIQFQFNEIQFQFKFNSSSIQ